MARPVITRKTSAGDKAPHAGALRLIYEDGTVRQLDSEGNSVPLDGVSVWSIFGRNGVVSAQAGDYDASQVTNDSEVEGSSVADALEWLNDNKSASDHNHAGVYAPASHNHDAAEVNSGTFDDARIAASNVTQHVGELLHQSLSGAGSNTHAQIDAHLGTANLHVPTDDTQAASPSYLWSSDKISSTFLAQSTRGASNGVAPLDVNSKVPVANLPSSVLGAAIYQGTWDASANDPELADGTGEKGWYYVVSDAGTQDLGSGAIEFALRDWVIHNGFNWEKVDNTDAVSSVAGKTGAVTLDTADVSGLDTALGLRVRVDEAQAFNDTQKIQALGNIGLAYNEVSGELEVVTVNGTKRILLLD